MIVRYRDANNKTQTLDVTEIEIQLGFERFTVSREDPLHQFVDGRGRRTGIKIKAAHEKMAIRPISDRTVILAEDD